MMRIGQGFDVHAFTEGTSLRVGGIDVPHDRAIAAHSDGDVLLHAICDALLGALGKGDIGQHFPDNDPAYSGADSALLLSEVNQMIRGDGWTIGNLDATLIAEKPKFSPYISSMQSRIAGILNIEPARVSVKATTTEKLGFIGREEGIAALAVVLLQQSDR